MIGSWDFTAVRQALLNPTEELLDTDGTLVELVRECWEHGAAARVLRAGDDGVDERVDDEGCGHLQQHLGGEERGHRRRDEMSGRVGVAQRVVQRVAVAVERLWVLRPPLPLRPLILPLVLIRELEPEAFLLREGVLFGGLRQKSDAGWWDGPHSGSVAALTAT